MVENRSTPTCHCQTSFLITDKQEFLLWQSGHLEKCRHVTNHPHTDTVFPPTQKTPLCWLQVFYPHFSRDETKARWAQGSLWDEHQNAWKPLAWSRGHCTELGRFAISFLPATGPFGGGHDLNVFGRKLLTPQEQFTGIGENGPLGAFSFKTCVPSKYLINTSIRYVFWTIPFNTRILWFSSLASSPAGQHFVMQDISKSPLKLLQRKQLIILKIPKLIQIHFLDPNNSESQTPRPRYVCANVNCKQQSKKFSMT